MARNVLPTSDNDFNVWLQAFVSNLTTNAGMVGLIPANLTPITTASGAFIDSLTNYQLQKALATSAIALKNTDRQEALAILRPLIQRICKHPGMTDQLRGLLGLGRDDTVQSPTPIELLTPPSLYLESMVGSVIVHFGPTPQNERTNGKPAGVLGCNIYRKKSGETQYQLVNFATSSPYTDTIVGSAADYQYVARYRGTKATELSSSSAEATTAARGELAA